MRPLQILHVTPYYEAAWAYGGIPRVVGVQARALAARGHRVTVCTTNAGGTVAQDRPVAVRVFDNWSDRLAYHLQLFLPRGLDRFLAAEGGRFDIAHVHACHNLLGVMASDQLRRHGVPYVLQPHGTAPLIERRRALKWLFDATVGRQVVPRASRLLAVSAAEERQLRSLGVPVRVVGNPLERNQFAGLARGAFRRRLGLCAEKLVLFLGKLTPRKQVDLLIEAFARLHRRDARLVIAGADMGSGGMLQRLARRLGVDAIFTGLLEGRDRLQALADADVVAYPSRDEVFGLVAVEAIACGTPVLVADDSGAGEVVGATGGGIVVSTGDVRALGDAVARVLDDSDGWRARAAEAAARVHAHCAPEAVCDRLEAVYREAIA